MKPAGTGIGTLTPIIGTSHSSLKRRAAPPSVVNTAVPLAYLWPLMSWRPSSNVLAYTMPNTGPKISSW